MHQRWTVPPTDDASGHLPRGVAIACDGALEWEVFDLLRRLDRIRVTACSELRQVTEVCADGDIDVAVIDLDHLRLEPTIHQSLGGLVSSSVRLVLISRSMAPAGIDVTRMRWLQRPVSAEHLVYTLRSTVRRPDLLQHAAR